MRAPRPEPTANPNPAGPQARAEAAKARREAEKAASLRANLARRKAQARAKDPTEPGGGDQPCR